MYGNAVMGASAVVGFCIGFVATFMIGITSTSDSACDGPCFDRWGGVELAGVVVGGLVAGPGDAEATVIEGPWVPTAPVGPM